MGHETDAYPSFDPVCQRVAIELDGAPCWFDQASDRPQEHRLTRANGTANGETALGADGDVHVGQGVAGATAVADPDRCRFSRLLVGGFVGRGSETVGAESGW
jgi:hypothetical protein